MRNIGYIGVPIIPPAPLLAESFTLIVVFALDRAAKISV
jgi:hypothetical protein